MEEWKDIPNYEGLYQISNLGRIKSLEKMLKNKNGYRKSEEKILIPQRRKNGYLKVELYKNGQRKTFMIHRLVGEAFVFKPENKCEINHKDGNKENCCVSNLEWITHSENMQHAVEKGLVLKGGNNDRAKKINQYDLQNNYIRTWECLRETERILKIHSSNISKCCKGKVKSAGGYIWRYADENN